MEISEYEKMYRAESTNWWFAGRRKLCFDIIESQFHHPISILDFGCGTGYNIQEMRGFGDVDGIDISPESAKFCMERNIQIHTINILCDDVSSFVGRYDLITCYDVLEHCPDDAAIISKLQTFLKPGGYLIITVPAFRFLWSRADDLLHHKRRYTKKELRSLLPEFNIQRISYTGFFIFIPVLMRKLLNPNTTTTGIASSKLTSVVMSIVYAIESAMVRLLHVPFGSSLVCLARIK